jgi:hypothetical protein
MTAIDSLASLSDAQLERMVTSAWRESARSWQEARREQGSLGRDLMVAAMAAEDYWRDLVNVQRSRLDSLADFVGPIKDDRTGLTPERVGYVTFEPVPDDEDGELDYSGFNFDSADRYVTDEPSRALDIEQ